MLFYLVAPFVMASGRRLTAWRTFIFRSWSRLFLRIAGVRLEVVGQPPEPPCVLVSNHLGYLDIMLLGSQVGGVFVAKRELARWPVIGLICRSMGTLFIDRRAVRDIPRVMERMERTLASGGVVNLFPEGTTSQGAEVAPFRPSLLQLPARAGLPVAWACLGYATGEPSRPAHLWVCWWGGMTFVDHLFRLLSLRRIRATIVFGQERFRERDRKHLARRLEEAVAGCFTPVDTQEGEWA